MATRWGTEHAGRRIEVEPESQWSGETLHLFVDGEEVASHKKQGSPITVSHDGLEVTAKLVWHGGSITEATLKAGDLTVPLEPAPGSREARKEQFRRDRPGLYAARHVVKAVAKLLVPLLGVGLLINLLPDISIDLPEIPFPNIPWPDIDIPLPDFSIDVPGWVRIVVVLLIAVAIAVNEWRKRRRHGTSRR